jgi:tetratricopeptide (TPR) repeat protein
MGEVYRAWDPSTQREVALKTRHSGEPMRFVREAQVMAAVVHPGIVRVFEAGVVQGVAYYASELVEGARELDQAWEGLPVEARVRLVRDAARAVGVAHARGIVHRDLKPANVLVDPAGRVRVTDFGVASSADMERLTRSRQLTGTPCYLSPEGWRVLDGERAPIAPPGDVWALGVILYEALCGKSPFEADTLYQLCAQVLDGQVEPPSQVDPSLPAPLDAVCLQALELEPDERFPDAEAFAAALDEALAGRGQRRRRRRRGLGMTLACGVTIVAGALGYWAWSQQAPSPQQADALPESDAQEASLDPDQGPDPLAGPLLLEAGKVAEALASFEARLVEAPDDWDARRGRAICLHELDREQEALAAMNELLAEDPDDDELYYRRVLLRWILEPGRWPEPDLDRPVPPSALYMRGHARYLFGRHQDARGDLDAALARNPEQVRILATRSHVRQSMGDLRGAIDDLSEVLSRGSARPALILAQRADLHRFLGERAEAEADLGEALRLEPDLLAAHLVRVNLMPSEEEALAAMDELVARFPDSTRVYLTRASYHTWRGDAAAALRDADRALECDPTNVDALAVRGAAHLTLGQVQPATRDLEEVLDQRPSDWESLVLLAQVRLYWEDQAGAAVDLLSRVDDDGARRPPPYITRGWALSALEDHEGAAAQFQRALELMDPGDYQRADIEHALGVQRRRLAGGPDAQGWMREGYAWMDRRQAENAATAFLNAIELDCTLVEAYVEYGKLVRGLGDREAGVDSFSRALQLAPDHRDALLHRGTARLEINDPAGAVEDLTRVLSLGPDDPETYAVRGMAYEALGQREEAQADYRRYLDASTPQSRGWAEIQRRSRGLE